MADGNYWLSHDAQDIDDTIDEVQAARGDAANLNARLDSIVGNFEDDQQRQEDEIGAVAALGAKNLFDINTSLPLKTYHTTYTLSDGSLTVTSTGNWGHHSFPVNLPAGTYIFTATISNFSKDSSASANSVRMRVTDTTATSGIEIALKTVSGNGAFELPFTWTGGQCYIQYYPNYSSTSTFVNSFTASNSMIRRAEITDDTFVSYAPTNRELYEMILALQSGRSLQSVAQLNRSEQIENEPDEPEEEPEER